MNYFLPLDDIIIIISKSFSISCHLFPFYAVHKCLFQISFQNIPPPQSFLLPPTCSVSCSLSISLRSISESVLSVDRSQLPIANAFFFGCFFVIIPSGNSTILLSSCFTLHVLRTSDVSRISQRAGKAKV